MKNTNNKICSKIEEILLKKYNDQKLNPDEIELLQNHLKDCKSCQLEEKLFAILRYKSESDSPNYILSGEEKRKVFEKIWERLNKNIAVTSQKLRVKKGHAWAKVPKIQEFFSYETPIYPNLLRSYLIISRVKTFIV